MFSPHSPYNLSASAMETSSSRRRRGNSQTASYKSPEAVGNDDVGPSARKQQHLPLKIQNRRRGKWNLRFRTLVTRHKQQNLVVRWVLGGLVGAIGTVFLLGIVGTLYTLLSRNHRRRNDWPKRVAFFHPHPEQQHLWLKEQRQLMQQPKKGRGTRTRRRDKDERKEDRRMDTPPGLLKVSEPASHLKTTIRRDDKKTSQISREPDYGDLHISLPLAPGIPRAIREYYYEPNTLPDDVDDDGVESEDYDEYYAFDDEIRRGTDGVAEKGYQDPQCRRIKEHRYMFPNCNDFHQLDRTDVANELRFINSGCFREVFSFRTPQDLFAVKEILFEEINDSNDYELMEYVRMDAIVAERLSASPRIYDIYGHCALSIASEYFYHGDIEDVSAGEIGYESPSGDEETEDDDDWQPKNGLTPAQKLVLGLDMAESLADLHGNAAGLIIHDDVQLSQFLLNKDKTRLKLNDFNRAEFSLWNGTDYCRHQNGKGPGSWRAPEEYLDQPLTEEIDVWSLGNNLYTMLTGRYPFYDLGDDAAKHVVPKGETAHIDDRYITRSPEEKALVEVIKGCFEYDPMDRVTIFEVVKHLRQALHENIEAKGLTREGVLQQIPVK